MGKKLMDYSNQNLSGLDLRNADLQFANLHGADLRYADLSRVKLDKADLSMANLYCANLTGASMVDANLTGASMVCAYLNNADLRKAILISADLTGAIIQGAKILGSNMRGTFLCDGLYQVTGCGKDNMCLTYDAVNDVVNCSFWNDGNGNKLKSFGKFIKDEYSIGDNNLDGANYLEYTAVYDFFMRCKISINLKLKGR